MNAPQITPQQTEEFVVVPGMTEAGTPIFSVLVKRTYDIQAGHQAVRAERTNPLVKIDVYYDHGDPEWATVKYETDFVPYKLATDVVLIGKAYAPAAKPVTQLDVVVEVAQHKKVIRVIGDRQCVYRENLPPSFTEPIEFTEMEIRYERAYGGTYMRDDPAQMFAYPRNSMGTGFTLKNIPEAVDGLALPNLEDPDDLLTPERVVMDDPYRWNQQPLPQGFGWFQRTWYPRCSFVGAVPGFVEPDEVMREEVLGLVPQHQIALARQFKLPSFDVRFNNGASLGLALPYLTGGEPVRLVNLTLESPLEFSLPKDTPRIMLDIGLGENELKAVLQTVCIRLEERQIDLVWRGAHEYPGVDWLPEMKRMVVQVS
jgi:hypothetical protein